MASENDDDCLASVESGIEFFMEEYRILNDVDGIERKLLSIYRCGYYEYYPELSLDDVYKRWLKMCDTKLKLMSSVLEYHNSMKELYKLSKYHIKKYKEVDKDYQKLIAVKQKLEQLVAIPKQPMSSQ